MSDAKPAENRRRIAVYLNADERRLVEQRATEWGVSLAAAIRRMIREYQGPAP